MTDADTPTDSDQADMAGTSMEDLPGADGTDTEVDVDVDAEAEDQRADELEDAQQDAAERREEEGGYQ
jgi:hypothetical protein